MSKIDEEMQKLLELVDVMYSNTDICKYYCTERVKKIIQNIFPMLSDNYFQIIPQSFIPDGDVEKVYIIPTSNLSLKYIIEEK